MRLFLLLLTVLFLAACTSSPKFDTTQVDLSLTPTAVTSKLEASRNKQVLWGGVIINNDNQKQHTIIEILAYPLDSAHLPLREQKPLGRFLIHHTGFLEPSEYAQGRMITILGRVDRLQNGKVGESSYLYPEIRSQQLHLWPKDSGQSKTRFSFGIGVRL